MTLPRLSQEERDTLHKAREVRARLRGERKRSAPPRVEKRGQEPRQIDKEHLKLIRRLPCLATLIRTGTEVYGVDAAHVRTAYPVKGWGGNPGMGRKPHDWRTLPLCRAEHRIQHGMNEQAYWRDLRVDPPSVCAELRACRDVEAMLAVIRRVAREARS